MDSPLVIALLAVNVVFNLIVWPPLYRRVVKDPRARDAAGKATKFLTVHMVLFVLAAVITLASAIAAIAALVG
ncbi:SCO4848 family membrane protein [Mycetocola zhadangensis]|uniref:Uncharacterized protein n=1 Tax=Mycetocola zhadangensis TaxID=1164595 RepID=A0A3L7J0E7_9MICO|nr:hypothetical protein [Mycetocola zhadangensis]RLQ83903.1 hypothetical protein D9V28_06525 [Mycetocola zhadangensis]GGE97871.1 hypothetical protein GCM10011313_21130 [Mycetocola zhadangensis]